jgi:hypothetical protein
MSAGIGTGSAAGPPPRDKWLAQWWPARHWSFGAALLVNAVQITIDASN